MVKPNPHQPQESLCLAMLPDPRTITRLVPDVTCCHTTSRHGGSMCGHTSSVSFNKSGIYIRSNGGFIGISTSRCQRSYTNEAAAAETTFMARRISRRQRCLLPAPGDVERLYRLGSWELPRLQGSCCAQPSYW